MKPTHYLLCALFIILKASNRICQWYYIIILYVSWCHEGRSARRWRWVTPLTTMIMTKHYTILYMYKQSIVKNFVSDLFSFELIFSQGIIRNQNRNGCGVTRFVPDSLVLDDLTKTYANGCINLVYITRTQWLTKNCFSTVGMQNDAKVAK